LSSSYRRQNQRESPGGTGLPRHNVTEAVGCAHPLSSTRGQLLFVGGLANQRSVGGVVETGSQNTPATIAQARSPGARRSASGCPAHLRSRSAARTRACAALPQMQVAVYPLHRDGLLGQLLEPLLDRRARTARARTLLRPPDDNRASMVSTGNGACEVPSASASPPCTDATASAQPVGLAGEVTADLVGIEIASANKSANGWRWPSPSPRPRCLHTRSPCPADSWCRCPQRSARRCPAGAPRAGFAPTEDPVELDIGVTPGLTRRNTSRSHRDSKITLCCSARVRHAWIGVQWQGGVRLFAERHALPGSRRVNQRQQKRSESGS